MDKIKILKINKFKDKRGYFFEILNNKNISKEIKIKNFKQLNLSYSKKNVLRGLHYQIKNSQGKLITVIKGEIFDVMLDLRNNSKTFGKVFSKYVRDKKPPSHNQTVKANIGVLLSFGKSAQKSQTAKEMTESLRCKDSKAFYKAIKLAAKLQKQSKFAVEFASTQSEPQSPFFADYLVSLYGTNP